MSTPKILWICNLPEKVRQKFDLTDVPGAAVSWVMGALPPPEDVELHIICPVFRLKGGPRHFEYNGAVWHCFELKRFEPLFLRRRFAHSVRSFVDELKPDVIHGWGGEVGGGLVATWLSKRAVVSVQGLLRMLKEGHWLRRLMEVMTYRRAAKLVCESETAREWLKKEYGHEAEVVTYSLRSEFLQPTSKHQSPITNSFLFIGQAVARKGYYDVQKAFEIVKSKMPDAQLTMVTGGKSSAEIIELMRAHAVFVLPSYGDTGPTAIKEALAQGMNVVVYDNTGPKELVEKYGGWLAKTGDANDLAEKMIEASKEVGRREEGVEARVKKEFGREKAWEDFRRVYGLSGGKRTAVLMTVHNRCETTVRCLRRLLGVVERCRCREEVDVFIVDDGSTDGTTERIKELGQGQGWNIKVIQGTGNLYWAKGMELAWKTAVANGEYDYFLWLNDDAELEEGALEKMFRALKPGTVVCGTMVNGKCEPTYGLNVRNTGLAGNCVLVPREVFEKVGMICGDFHHGWADRDYGLQVEKAGFEIVSAGVVGRTEWHPMRPSLKGRDLRWRLRSLRDPKGWNVHDLWLLRKRNWGVCAAVVSSLHLIAHVLLGER